MKCRICASECPPGAKLCRDCAAARKRAFAATVTQPLLMAAGAPSVSQARFAPRPSKPRAARRSSVPSGARLAVTMAEGAVAGRITPRKPSGMRWLLLGLSAVIAAVYLLSQFLAIDRGEPGGEAAATGDAAREFALPAVTAPSAAAPTPESAPSSLAAAPASAQEEASPIPVTKGPKTPHHKAPLQVQAPPTPAAPSPAPVAEAAPVVRTAPPPPVELAKDPWQAMNEGLSRCANEDWMRRGQCEQRLRLQYCPNHWGTVWQCPIGPAADRGQ